MVDLFEEVLPKLSKMEDIEVFLGFVFLTFVFDFAIDESDPNPPEVLDLGAFLVFPTSFLNSVSINIEKSFT